MKKIIFLIFLVCLLLLGGCGPSEEGYGSYRTGTDGLILKFLPNTPPPVTYAGDNIDILMEIANKGAYDIRGGKLYLMGFDRNIIGIYDNFFMFEGVDGKNEFNSDGDKLILDDASNTRIRLQEGVEKHNTQITAAACYEYQTTASFPICIDPNPKLSSHDACSPRDISGSSQGDPVAVIKVEVESGEGRIRLIITARNVGTGEVMDYDSCPFGYKYDEINNIRNYDVEIAGVSLQCEPDSRELKFGENQQAKIYCKAEGLDINQAAYTTPITITLDYDYKTSTSTSIEVREEI